jgi:hypothetical protein
VGFVVALGLIFLQVLQFYLANVFYVSLHMGCMIGLSSRHDSIAFSLFNWGVSTCHAQDKSLLTVLLGCFDLHWF